MADPVIDIHQLLDWIARHPDWMLAAVFTVALTESLVVVGLVVPGALLMIGAGALIGVGVAGFWPTVIAAIAGAVIGDGASFIDRRMARRPVGENALKRGWNGGVLLVRDR